MCKVCCMTAQRTTARLYICKEALSLSHSRFYCVLYGEGLRSFGHRDSLSHRELNQIRLTSEGLETITHRRLFTTTPHPKVHCLRNHTCNQSAQADSMAQHRGKPNAQNLFHEGQRALGYQSSRATTCS